MELVLTGRRIDAAEAHAARARQPGGPAQGLAGRGARAGARSSRSRPPLAVRLGKQAVLAADETPLTAGLESRAAPVRAGDGDRGPGRGHDRVRREAPAGVPRAVIARGRRRRHDGRRHRAAGLRRRASDAAARPAPGGARGAASDACATASTAGSPKGRADAGGGRTCSGPPRRSTDLAGCELVIEAAPERPDLKRELFAELSRVCADDTVLATNTCSIPVTSLAGAAAQPGERRRHALLQPAAADGAARGDSRRSDRRPGARSWRATPARRWASA